MICQVCKQDHTDKNMRWCDRSDLQIENDYLRAENARYREALEHIKNGPFIIESEVWNIAREALRGE